MTNIMIFKKSIQTLLDQLPQYIVEYELQERELITEFLAIISQFEKADNDRETLANHFSHYSEKVMKTPEYLSTPFLWYTVTFAEHAIYNLSISRFHAIEFYKFLLYQLRELYQMMKKHTPLLSTEYDQLQAKCEQGDFILTSDEFEILKSIYLSIENGKIESFSSKYIKKKIMGNTTISSKNRGEKEISRFYTLVGGEWWFQFNSSCFGLKRIFFHIVLSKNINLATIIDFNDSENTVLGVSEVFQVLKSKNEYLGTLLIPIRDIDALQSYFRHCEQNKYLKIISFTPLMQKRRCRSFKLYQPDLGWEDLTPKEQKTLIQNFHTEETEKGIIKKSRNPNQWSYTEFPYPQDVIQLYCKSPDKFNYSELPLDKTRGDKEKSFSMTEIGILRYLITKKALEIGFTPWRLIHNWSVNIYCIKLPKIPLNQMDHFLNLIPYGEIYYSDQQNYAWTRLSEKFHSIIKNDLGWEIYPVSRIHTYPDLKLSWYESKNLQWKKPVILLTEEKKGKCD